MMQNETPNLPVSIGDIFYIQAEHIYVRFHLRNRQTILHRGSLTAIWEELREAHFLRIHRSYIVNLRSVTYFTPTYVMLGNKRIAIGRVYRDNTLAVLKQLLEVEMNKTDKNIR